MLAKAIANEASVQVSLMSQCQPSFTSKWFGEDEKNIRALFTLPAKVYSMIGQRTRIGEHEAMRKRMKDMEKKQREEEGQSSEDASNNKDKEEQEIKARSLNMEDMRQAKSQWMQVLHQKHP
ncbi:hypothetical protein AAZX31_16G160400 [Glycine max]|nr:hypothetical protein GLYMA_16G176500v4 [Glycine max]